MSLALGEECEAVNNRSPHQFSAGNGHPLLPWFSQPVPSALHGQCQRPLASRAEKPDVVCIPTLPLSLALSTIGLSDEK